LKKVFVLVQIGGHICTLSAHGSVNISNKIGRMFYFDDEMDMSADAVELGDESEEDELGVSDEEEEEGTDMDMMGDGE